MILGCLVFQQMVIETKCEIDEQVIELDIKVEVAILHEKKLHRLR